MSIVFLVFRLKLCSNLFLSQYYMNNDLIEGDSAFCQHMETLLVKALAEINSVLKY